MRPAMRLTPALVDAYVAAAAAVLRFDQPADTLLSAFFRAHPRLGVHDRGFVAESVYALLRRKRLLEFALAEIGIQRPDARTLALAALVRVSGSESARDRGGCHARGVRATRGGEGRGAWDAAARRRVRPPGLGGRTGAAGAGRERACAALPARSRSLRHLDLRVNLFVADRAEVAAALAADGIEAQPMPYSPVGLRVARQAGAQPASPVHIRRHPGGRTKAARLRRHGWGRGVARCSSTSVPARAEGARAWSPDALDRAGLCVRRVRPTPREARPQARTLGALQYRIAQRIASERDPKSSAFPVRSTASWSTP